VELGGVSASATGRNGGNVGKRMKKKRLLSLRDEGRAREMRRARRAPVGDLYSIFLNLSRQTLWVNGCSMLLQLSFCLCTMAMSLARML
jgi:hypothetical protein